MTDCSPSIIDGDRHRALRGSHAGQSTRLFSRNEGGRAIDGAVGRRLDRQYIICRWPPRISRRDRLQRYEVGAKGDDQSGSNRSGTAQHPDSVHPGPIDTELLKVRTPEQNRERLRLVPMNRMGTAEEVASLVLFLLSDESGYVTGAEVAIDGGATL